MGDTEVETPAAEDEPPPKRVASMVTVNIGDRVLVGDEATEFLDKFRVTHEVLRTPWKQKPGSVRSQ
jgi:hypothetical protein